VAERTFYGIEVVRAAEEGSGVRVLYRRLQRPGALEELRAAEVLFCTGTLQRPRRVTLVGEDNFAGPIVYGYHSHAEALDLRGKSVVVLGMGAFAIENARTALFNGAARVDMVVRHKLVVMTRFARVVAIDSQTDYSSNRDRASRHWGPPYPVDPSLLIMPPYIATGAQSAMPNAWLRAIKAGRTPNVWQSDSATNLSTSDVFFIAHALGRLEVHTGEVSHVEPCTVVIDQGKDGSKRIRADALIKNFGFESPDQEDRMGGTCEVVAQRTCSPPIWITPRIITFRHCTEVASMAAEDWAHADELFNFVGSGTFASSAYLEIFLHYRRRPEQLRRLLDSDRLPRKPISKTTKLDMSRGLEGALAFDKGLRERVNAQRRAINEATWQRYARPGTAARLMHKAWVQGFLEQNRADWEDTCRRLTGDPHAVPYIWGSGTQRDDAVTKQPTIQSAL